jgi:TCP-1/cpn60 chaperonin family
MKFDQRVGIFREEGRRTVGHGHQTVCNANKPSRAAKDKRNAVADPQHCCFLFLNKKKGSLWHKLFPYYVQVLHHYFTFRLPRHSHHHNHFEITTIMASTMRLQELSPNAEIVSKSQARIVNVAAAVGLQNVLKSNLGPKGTLKLLVGGAGQLKLTKDGLVLLKEMQIQHPTAAMIARTATAQDDVTGDGTTSTVLLCGSILQQADRYCREGLHARVVVDGLELAREAVLEFLKNDFAMVPEGAGSKGLIGDRELLHHVALTSLRTKLDPSLADSVRRSYLCFFL